MRLGTVVDYDGRRKYIGKRILKMQSEAAKRLLGNPAIVYDFKREDGHVVSVAKNIFDKLEAAASSGTINDSAESKSQAEPILPPV